jgi:hypothetical protein
MEPLHRLGPNSLDDRITRFHPQRVRPQPFSRVSATLSNTPTADQSGPKCRTSEVLGEMILSARGFVGRSRALLPVTTDLVTTISPWWPLRALLVRPTESRFGSCCSDPLRHVGLAPIGMPNRLIDQLEARLSMTSEPTHWPFDNEMKGSSCTITHITASQTGTRCPTTATTSSPSPLTTPRASGASPRTPLRATRMCNKLPAVYT